MPDVFEQLLQISLCLLLTAHHEPSYQYSALDLYFMERQIIGDSWILLDLQYMAALFSKLVVYTEQYCSCILFGNISWAAFFCSIELFYTRRLHVEKFLYEYFLSGLSLCSRSLSARIVFLLLPISNFFGYRFMTVVIGSCHNSIQELNRTSKEVLLNIRAESRRVTGMWATIPTRQGVVSSTLTTFNGGGTCFFAFRVSSSTLSNSEKLNGSAATWAWSRDLIELKINTSSSPSV